MGGVRVMSLSVFIGVHYSLQLQVSGDKSYFLTLVLGGCPSRRNLYGLLFLKLQLLQCFQLKIVNIPSWRIWR